MSFLAPRRAQRTHLEESKVCALRPLLACLCSPPTPAPFPLASKPELLRAARAVWITRPPLRATYMFHSSLRRLNAILLRIQLRGARNWLNWPILHMQVLASHTGTRSCPGCSTPEPAPCSCPEREGRVASTRYTQKKLLALEGLGSGHCSH